jgi:hypothetical protein
MSANPADALAGFFAACTASFIAGWICHYCAAAIHHHLKGR